jgi:hypothetical protein
MYCPSCGAEIGDHLTFCPKCGAQIVEAADKAMPLPPPPPEYAQKGHAQFQQPQQALPQLVQRNYLIWFLLTFVTGIVGLIYLYIIFEDMKKLDQYPKPKGVPSITLDQNQLILIIVLYVLGLGLIANYIIYSKKYGMFNDYLDAHPQKQEKLPSRNYIKLMIGRDIMFLLSGLFFAVGPIVSALTIDLGNTYLAIAGTAPLSTAMVTFVLFTVIFSVIGGLLVVGGMIIAIYQIVLDFRWQEAMNERVRIVDPKAPMKDFI